MVGGHLPSRGRSSETRAANRCQGHAHPRHPDRVAPDRLRPSCANIDTGQRTDQPPGPVALTVRAGAAPWSALELLHPIPSTLTTVAAVGFALIFGIGVGDSRLWWIAGIMLLVQFSISALNEWADADLDRHAGRRRPIALGLVSPST